MGKGYELDWVIHNVFDKNFYSINSTCTTKEGKCYSINIEAQEPFKDRNHALNMMTQFITELVHFLYPEMKETVENSEAPK